MLLRKYSAVTACRD